MSGAQLHVIAGAGGVVDYLQGLADAARAGDITAVICASLDDEGVIGCGHAFRDDVPHKWAMSVAMAAVLQDMLMEGDE